MKALERLMRSEKKDILSLYYTAGFPNLQDTLAIALEARQAGADMLEIGIPFSDPVADGPVIQASNQKALDNGMTLALLFDQLELLPSTVDIPVLLMGYFNPIFQFGVERFCQKCKDCGIEGLIIPDLPMDEYEETWKSVFQAYDLHLVFLITPQTPDERILKIDALSQSFIYMVSSASVTGARQDISHLQEAYFERIKNMNLLHPALIGFGISSAATFQRACSYHKGAIIGSAFISLLENTSAQDRPQAIRAFIQSLRA